MNILRILFSIVTESIELFQNPMASYKLRKSLATLMVNQNKQFVLDKGGVSNKNIKLRN